MPEMIKIKIIALIILVGTSSGKKWAQTKYRNPELKFGSDEGAVHTSERVRTSDDAFQ
jgi:hypothetical protein